MIPPHEVYAVLRENGFLPLGIPHRLGAVYEIAATGPNGQGRLLIDGRTGRIVRFRPAYGGGPGAYWGGPEDDSYQGEPYDLNDSSDANDPQRSAAVRGGGPPSPVPHADSRAVGRPAPKSAARAKPSERARMPAQKPANAPGQVETRAAGAQSAPKPANAPAQVQARAAAAAPVTTDKAGETRIAVPLIKPTEVAPPVQGLE